MNRKDAKMPFALYECTKEDIAETGATWDGIWQSTTLERQLQQVDTDDQLPIFIKYLPRNGKILEAGCGLGRWVIYLKRNGFDIMGIDFAEQAINSIKAYDNSMPVEIGNIFNIQYPDRYFDAYISLGVVEHFQEGPYSALKEARRTLTDNGIALVSVPFFNPIRHITLPIEKIFLYLRENEHIRKIFKKGSYPEKHFVEYRFTRREFYDILDQSGFKIETIIPFCHLSLGLFNYFLEPLPLYSNKWAMKINKKIARLTKIISPWLAAHMIMCIVRKK